MEDCRLCGGKLNADGRCTECGLDNSKSDKKYHLNTHNDRGSLLHRGDCEDNLNQDNSWGLFIPDRKSRKKRQAVPNRPREQAKRRKELRERRQTGTVKRKGSCAGSIFWIILIIWCLYYAFSAVRDEVSGGWTDVGSVFSELLSDEDEDNSTLRENDDFEEDPRDGWTWTGL